MGQYSEQGSKGNLYLITVAEPYKKEVGDHPFSYLKDILSQIRYSKDL